ncbi:MAG: hypothetical protein R3F15_12135 [Lysobacterales bacterium]
MTSTLLVVVALLLLLLFLQPRLLRSERWRATVTPLASIIGSGFLVAGPILAHAVGSWAWLAMLGLCVAAWIYGAALRHNIRYVEPQLESGPAPLRIIEQLSDLALAFAYFVSVAYYLNLFAAFGLRLGGVVDPFWIRVTATTVIAALGLLGATRGLRGMEHLEVLAVGLKLAAIGGLLAALALVNGSDLAAGQWQWSIAAELEGFEQWRVVMGLLILVQGFETSRYLGSSYSAELRISSMRHAQLIAAAIYLLFLLGVTAYFTPGLEAQGGETAIIDLLTPLGAAVAPVLIVAALASQLSAATADMNGASGLVAESTRQRVPVAWGNAATAAIAIVITWWANLFQIIAIASQVFVAYYALQSLQATRSCWQMGRRWRAILFAVATLLGLVIVVFAAPAEA